MSNGTIGQSLLKAAIIWMIRFYQVAFSCFLGPCCRFTPSCSSYALLAIERFGVFRGGLYAMRRLVRCHPLDPGGYDPLPDIPEGIVKSLKDEG